ncbi:TPA: aminoglycoside phosphotransferase [Candidatus Kaiserbacteria bacterium]|nr:MAG: Aminoglycoside N3'-acetyltransferase [Parcubacteria group bacterium GW2011_GWA1_56_13]KKW46326.1 MAG: Aminoglycoside N3'-acetyltransferase [Parcubacteria group bacterium GW2011_GWB1_57_6]HCR52253.1 aminoglycoside phosphotransferase [Candidatus Kaiserbacteria bacterium]
MELFRTDNGASVKDTDVLAAFRQVGIKQGDLLFVHSSLKAFGMLAQPDTQALMAALVTAFTEIIGEKGTLIMPTFTDNFLKGKPYHTDDRSTVGALTEFYRGQPGVSRTLHPFFSVATRGPRSAELADISHDSFDAHSIFGNVHRLDGLLVFFGARFQSCTFVHYVEQIHGVPYRFMKTFEGVIVDGERSYRDSYTYFVRPLDGNVDPEFSRLGKRLLDSGMMREAPLGHGRVFAVRARDLFDEGSKLLDADIYSLLKQKP